MDGLTLSKRYFESYGYPMLSEEFPELLPQIAVGLFGSGSECYGFDDAVSTDHDFEPGFCIFLPGEDIVDRKAAFQLERAYAKLPKEYEGFSRSLMQPVGGARHGVFRTADWFMEKAGTKDGSLSVEAWLRMPSEALAEATNGAVFLDNYGEVTKLREMLSRFPEDIKKKRLAGHLLLAAQAGQYNYTRCLSHGEQAAAQLAVFEFAKHAISSVFLLNDVYEPYYKWSFRALRALPRLSIEAELLEYLITTDNEDATAQEKADVIEGICADLIDELIDQKLTQANCGDLEKHAYSVNDGIADGDIRNLHILAAV